MRAALTSTGRTPQRATPRRDAGRALPRRPHPPSSKFPWEREALAYLRAGLPDHEPFRAWSNVEFVADDGSVNQVNLIVVMANGLFVVEIKSYSDGLLSGDSQVKGC